MADQATIDALVKAVRLANRQPYQIPTDGELDRYAKGILDGTMPLPCSPALWEELQNEAKR